MQRYLVLLLCTCALIAAVAIPEVSRAGPRACKYKTDMRATVEVTQIAGVPQAGPTTGKVTPLGLRRKFKPRDKSSVFHNILFNTQFLIQGCRTRGRKDIECVEAVNMNLMFDGSLNPRPTLTCGGQAFLTYSYLSRDGEIIQFVASSCTVQIKKSKKKGKRLAGTFEAVFEDFAGNEFVVTDGCFKSRGKVQAF